ncbi:TonB-dependent receptor, partial [Acetobacter tropicalis]|uniref:TonB-dependent receptor n=1 Tax=Acetobacter tropicalis TaxID=104102 RepID=UPI0011BDF41B
GKAKEEAINVSGIKTRGGGMMRHETSASSVQTVTKPYIEMQSPTSTALDLVKNLPSVSVQNFDSSGMRGGNILSRSLTDNDMAITLDGIPASSAQYLANNVDSENIKSVSITPATVAIDLPVTSAAAGVMDEQTITPSHKFGGMTDFSYGTNNLSREFIRINTGDIGKNGPRAYISFSHAHARNWNGPGTADRKHIDFGMSKDFENGSNIKLFLSWNHQDNIWYSSIREAAFNAEKNNRSYTNYNYAKEYNPQNPSSYYKNAGYNQETVFLTAPTHIVLSKKITLNISPYYFDLRSFGNHYGNITGGSTYYGAQSVPVALGGSDALRPGQTTPYISPWNIDNPNVGAVAKFDIQVDKHNHLQFGYWYNYTDANTVETLGGIGSNLNYTGINYNIVDNSYSPKAYRNRDNNAGYETHALFIEHISKYLENKLTISAGFKLAMINQWAHNRITNDRHGSNYVVPLPQLSASYMINKHHQVYLNAEGDFRLPDASSLLLTYGITNGKISGAPSYAKPQYAIKEELGYRYLDKNIIIDFSLFNYSITNRLLSVTNFVDGAQISQTINAGNQTARGFDLMISTPSIHHFSPYASFEYLYAREDSNIPSQGDLLPTKGLRPVQAPSIMANFGLTYDNGNVFGNVGIHYTGSQYATFMNDQKIPGYITDSIAIGYRFPSFWLLHKPVFKMNFNNITGSFVRTGIFSPAANYRTVKGIYGTTMSGGTGSNFYLMPRFNMTGSISVDF